MPDLAAIRANLKTAILTQLPTLTVHTSPAGSRAGIGARQWLEFNNPDVVRTGEDLAVGFRDTIDLEGTIHVNSPGTGDTVAATAETAAMTILAGIQAALEADLTLGGEVAHVEISDYLSKPAPGPVGRTHTVELTITAIFLS
jgi:hypothetical protein